MVNVTDAEAQEARSEQSKSSKRATLAALKKKKQSTREFEIELSPGEKSSMLFKAIDAASYDKLVAKYPPSKEEEANGAIWDYEKFAPALIAAVSCEPRMSHEEVLEIWTSPEYNRGDRMALFGQAVAVCSTGFDIPFSERG